MLGHGRDQRIMQALLRRDQRRVGQRLRLHAVGRHVPDRARRDVGDVVEVHVREVDARLGLEALHHRVAQRVLVGEVPVHRALVYPRALGNGPDRQAVPVPDRRLPQQGGGRAEDAFTRLRRLRPPHRAVVAAALTGGARVRH